MKEAIIKNRIVEYAETIISPALVEDLHIEETISDEHGDTNVWLIESDTGEEYWVLEGDNPSNIYKRSGIYKEVTHVYIAYIVMLEEQNEQKTIPDRFSIYHED